MIYGAIAGDIIGSRFEFDRPNWRRDFELFTDECEFTDDTVMTIAVADAVLNMRRNATEEIYKRNFIERMQWYGNRFPNAGYGMGFKLWLKMAFPQPYNSFGNGSAMRVSPIGWVYDDLDKTREVARWSAEISHDHPEGVKGAESIATAIWMARNGFKKEDIATAMIEIFDYDLSKTVDECIPEHEHNETCMDSVPKALVAFLEGEDFEQVIRNAVAMGGDTDTIAAIAGSVAEAMYGVPEEIKQECRKKLGPVMAEMVDLFERNASKYT